MSDDTYHLPVGERGRAQRIIHNQLRNPTTQQFLLAHGLRPGLRILELGCGIGIMSAWLAEQVGPQGNVVAIDNHSEQLQIATEIAEEYQLKNIEFKQLNSLDIRSLKQSFDLIYCRHLLVHLLQPSEQIQAVYDVLAPKGTFICESAIMGNEQCYPESPAFTRWRELNYNIFTKLGKDPKTGQKVHTMMHDVGFKQLTARLYTPVIPIGLARREILVNDLMDQSAYYFKYGLSTEQEIADLQLDLHDLENDPRFFMTATQSCQIVGTK